MGKKRYGVLYNRLFSSNLVKNCAYGTKDQHVISSVNKVNELKEVMAEYYPTRRDTEHSLDLPITDPIECSLKERCSFEDSLRNYYKAKAAEQQKLHGALETMQRNRPLSVDTKVRLIAKDYKQRKHIRFSAKKFHSYRVTVERLLREKQSRNYNQAIAYLNCLENLKEDKDEPTAEELIFLEIWRQVVQGGWIMDKPAFNMMLQNVPVNRSAVFEENIGTLRGSLE